MKKIASALLVFNLGFASSLQFRGMQYINRNVLDAGDNASICVVDFDHDGKKDLVVGNKEGNVLFYKNTGVDQAPSFQNPTKVEIDTGAIKLLGGFSSPIVCQWDGVKDLDLIIGDGNGKIFLAKAINDIIPGSPPKYNNLIELQADNKPISLPGNASPYVWDVDEDGLLDLLAGDSHGYVWFFKNIGRPDLPLLSAGTKTLVGSESLDVSQYAKPVMNDWDGDGKKDLIVGDIFGNIHIFNPGTQAGTGTFIPNFVFKEKAKVSGADIDVGFNASPWICDWNNDGGYDLLVGGESGEIFLFLNTKYTNSEPPEFNVAQKVSMDFESKIDVGKYSKPYVIDWNNDKKKDLILGDEFGRVQVFLNSGDDSFPQFTDSFFFPVLSGTKTEDLDVGYMSAPVPCDWNGDGKKDLVVGNSLGNIQIFINTNTDEAPIFSKGTFATTKEGIIDVGNNATPIVCDWNNDGMKDLLVGCSSGEIRLFLNTTSDINPIFDTPTTINLPFSCDVKETSPCIIDYNKDYKKDLIIGAGYGELYLFINSGKDDAPVFNKEERLRFSNGVDIKANNNASPCVADWDCNGSDDIIVGGEDGRVFVCLSTIVNYAPSVIASTPIGTQSGNVNVSYTLRDEDGDTCSIDVSFSKDGGFTWNNATSGDGGDGKTGLSSSAIGISHIFVWETEADLGQGIYNIILKITPRDGINQGISYKTGTFPLDNTLKSSLIPIQVSGKNLDIGAYSIPCVCDWNNDGKKDLLVGDEYGYVTLFLNSGTDENPVFNLYQRLQVREEQAMIDLKVGGFSAPWVVDYNNDKRKDLLVGDKFGYIYYFENIGKDEAPVLQKGIRIQGGSDLDVGNRAIPHIIDYDQDKRKDLIVGDEYGYIRLYLNSGSDDKPVFATETKLLLGTGNTEISVPYNSAPTFIDWNDNGKSDLLVGDRNGNLWLFLNYGSDSSPKYDYGRIIPEIKLSGNATIFTTSWDNYGKWLVLGDKNGSVYLYQLKEGGNTPPYCNILPNKGGMGTISIKYKLYDIDGDTCLITPAYSLDGINWQVASGSPVDNLVGSGFGVDYEFLWNSNSFLPNTKTLVYFRITPRDKKTGTSNTISFLLDNLNSPPSLENLSLSSNSGIIEVLFNLKDPDNDTMTVSCDYLPENGTWTKASIYGEGSFTSGFCKLYWASSIDLGGTKTICTIRLIPFDQLSTGGPQTKTITIDNLRFSGKEIKREDVGLPISFSPTTIIPKSLGYDIVVSVEKLSISSSLSGLSDTARKITAIRKDRPDIAITSLPATLILSYNDQLFAEDIEGSFVIYKENTPLPSSVDVGSNTVSADISSTGIYRIDALFPFSSKPLVWPNPCKAPIDTINFGISGRKKIFTLMGELVNEFDNNTWDTRNKEGDRVASGIYIWFSEETKQKGLLAIVR